MDCSCLLKMWISCTGAPGVAGRREAVVLSVGRGAKLGSRSAAAVSRLDELGAELSACFPTPAHYCCRCCLT